MTIEKLTEFAKTGNKNTDDLDLETGFIPSRKPARQWFNWLFNTLTLKINEIIDGKIDGSSIVDNLITDDATKPVSAKQAKLLQDNKLDANKRGAANGVASLDENTKVPVEQHYIASTTQNGIVQLVNDLITGGIDKALTAEQGKLLLEMFNTYQGFSGYFKIPNPSNLSKPTLFQWGATTVAAGSSVTVTLPTTMPNSILQIVFGAQSTVNGTTPISPAWQALNSSSFTLRNLSTITAAFSWFAIGN